MVARQAQHEVGRRPAAQTDACQGVVRQPGQGRGIGRQKTPQPLHEGPQRRIRAGLAKQQGKLAKAGEMDEEQVEDASALSGPAISSAISSTIRERLRSPVRIEPRQPSHLGLPPRRAW